MRVSESCVVDIGLHIYSVHVVMLLVYMYITVGPAIFLNCGF